MRASAEQVLPKWDRDLPGYGTILSCRSFANEECGNHAVAEGAGWQALEIDPADFWGIHAVAHVMEMQGRRHNSDVGEKQNGNCEEPSGQTPPCRPCSV